MPTITSGSIYKNEYCVDFTGGQCIQWLTIQSLSQEEVKELGVSIFWNAFVFFAILMVLGWIFRILFGKFFGGRN